MRTPRGALRVRRDFRRRGATSILGVRVGRTGEILRVLKQDGDVVSASIFISTNDNTRDIVFLSYKMLGAFDIFASEGYVRATRRDDESRRGVSAVRARDPYPPSPHDRLITADASSPRGSRPSGFARARTTE